MSDIKIKIISNPYNNTISYYKFSDESNEWVDFNNLEKYDGKMIEKDFSSTFFPFKVKEIVERIKKEWPTKDHPVSLLFEGTKDEFDDLCNICNEKEYEGIQTNYSCNQLENARDILPEIKAMIPEIEKIYNNLEVLLDNDNIPDIDFDGEKIKSELRKVKEATGPLIPVCIIGNYSSGKSSFINALVGKEILPNGDEPVTAKIFKISRSKTPDTAIIKYTSNNAVEKIIFNGTGVVKDDSLGVVYNSIISELSNESENNMFRFINKSLEILNNYEKNHSDADISDLIELIVPFGDGLLGKSKYDYVIFDTPGSNTASNLNHIKVMEDAMANMSNGIPIYISEYDTLDTIDNKNLYEQIKEIDELDTRFTFIIVNKADSAKLPANGFDDEKELEVLDEEVPRNLYAGGLFFVSSVIALGAKTNGEFFDSHYSEIYEEKLQKYSKPDAKNYKQLYKYNIIPPQIKQKTYKDAEQCQNLVLANSGIYTIENEIETFAEKYSAYNKCQQSYKHIDRAIDTSKKYIETAKDKCVKDKVDLEIRLERDRKSLGDKLDNEKAEQFDEAKIKYRSAVFSAQEKAEVSFSVDDLKTEFNSFYEKEYNDNVVFLMQESYNTQKSQKKKEQTGFWSDAKNNRNLADFRRALQKTLDDAKELKGENDKIKAKESECKKAARDKLINVKEKECHDAIIKGYELMEKESDDYWKKASESIKNKLSDTVTESSELSEEKREELSSIIVNYEEARFDNSDIEKFKRESLSSKFNLGAIHLISSDTPNYKELSKEFFRCLHDGINKYTEIIEEKYTKAFEGWINRLLETVKNKMVEYNPSLYKQFETIKKTEANIDALANCNKMLEDYSKSIKELISWKTVEKEG